MDSTLEKYVHRQLQNTPKIVGTQTTDDHGQLLSERLLVDRIKQYVGEFLATPKSSQRWVVIPGLRGVGKTVAMLQTLHYTQQALIKHGLQPVISPLYISLDEVVYDLRADLSELIKTIESLVGCDFSALKQPVFLFIDEVQTDPRWAKTLKFVYDRSSLVFMCCSGSSATQLQMDADVAGRRAVIERMYPLSFTEYCRLKSGQSIQSGLAQELGRSLYYSEDARGVYQSLTQLSTAVKQAWLTYDTYTLNQYLEFGTLLTTINMTQTDQVTQHLTEMLDRIAINDLADNSDGSEGSLRTVRKLLPLLAVSGDILSLPKMCELVGVSRQSLETALQRCARAELLIKIPADGKQIKATRLPARYLFMSPALRRIYSRVIIGDRFYATHRGLLLEDLAGLYYYREFIAPRQGYLSYPYTRKSNSQCDFILQTAGQPRRIAIEFGLGKKSDQQVIQTMKRTKCDYGLVFSHQELRLNEAENVVAVPLDYFYLF